MDDDDPDMKLAEYTGEYEVYIDLITGEVEATHKEREKKITVDLFVLECLVKIIDDRNEKIAELEAERDYDPY